MIITGRLLIGSRDIDRPGGAFHAVNPATGQALAPAFATALAEDIDRACLLAAEAFASFRVTSAEERASFLERIATGIESLDGLLIERTLAETGLPQARLEGERGRTCGQLRLFARVLRYGLWRQLALDTALPERRPASRPDLRMQQIALGPVAIFGASNFPLAFSVAGGDTASALAAGCPVVVKAHPSHPGTSELIARVIREAVRHCGLHEGVFSMVAGEGHEIGRALVVHPAIQAVGFTGSRAGGQALLRAAQGRAQPIPVYAEMSSINPMFLLPAALAARAEPMAKDFVDSLVLGVGQFCTNPGLVVGVAGAAWSRFVAAVAAAVAVKSPGTMLNQGIHRAYGMGIARLADVANVTPIAQGKQAGLDGYQAQAVVHETSAEHWLKTPALEEEIFGPSSLLIRCEDVRQMHAVAERMCGQLTVTLQLQESDADDIETARQLLPILETKAGRILANGYPTGVEVSYAMMHGGPFPATSDSRSTSVGASAILRFLRPVCYQNIPDSLLPAILRRANVRESWHLLDGILIAPAAPNDS